ncbi:MAG: hypothetical protein KDB01_26250 [Planctomycetaceae bacterium]|nr:hypothetical protein [Planctomycetaceae bacterium]
MFQMKSIYRLPRVLIAMGISLLITNSSTAQHDGEKRATDDPSPGSKYYGLVDSIPGRLMGPCSRSLAVERVAATSDILDPAFDVYARPELIGTAYSHGDSVLLTDVALQLAEGERVLLRSRKAITVAQAMDLAINAAGQRQDTTSLHRIAKFAEMQGNKELAEKVAAAIKLAAVSRDTTSGMMVSVEDITTEDYAKLRECSRQIERARLTGDTRGLEALDLDIEGCIPNPFHKHFRKIIGDARAAIPAEHKVDDQLVGMLIRLAAISRDGDEENDEANMPVEVSGGY